MKRGSNNNMFGGSFGGLKNHAINNSRKVSESAVQAEPTEHLNTLRLLSEPSDESIERKKFDLATSTI